jgi:heat shock protein HslJ
MKKINYLLIVTIVAFSAFLFTSCKKEKSEVNMVVKNWTLESKTVAGLNVETSCENDSKWNFKSDNTYTINDDCNNTQTGTWSLSDDGKTLTLDSKSFYQVTESSIAKLVIELQVGDVGLVRWTFR